MNTIDRRLLGIALIVLLIMIWAAKIDLSRKINRLEQRIEQLEQKPNIFLQPQDANKQD